MKNRNRVLKLTVISVTLLAAICLFFISPTVEVNRSKKYIQTGENVPKSTSGDASEQTHKIENSNVSNKGGIRHYRFVLGILSSARIVQKRHATRSTWLGNFRKALGSSLFSKFIFGVLKNPADNVLLNLEQDKHGDILRFDQYIDTYKNLTYKVKYFIDWVYHHDYRNNFTDIPDSEKFTYDYLLKADDDIYLMIGRLLDILVDNRKNYYFGSLLKSSRVLNNTFSKNREQNFKSTIYQFYAQGPFYGISYDLVNFLGWLFEREPFIYNSEDVCIGVWTSLRNPDILHMKANLCSDPNTVTFFDTRKVKELQASCRRDNGECYCK